MQSSNPARPTLKGLYLSLATATLVLTYILIVVGGATRVYDAGMSCPDWPHCYGLWWPWPESRVIALTHPEGYVVAGQHFAWWQVFLEWSHRGLAAIVGFGILGLLALAWPTRQPRRVWVALAAVSVLLALQISLGGLTVLKSNVNWSVAAHLGTAMILLSAIAWLRRAVAIGHAPVAPLKVAAVFNIALPAMALLVWVTMVVGGMVSSSHAGGLCGGLPSCAGAWWPNDTFQQYHMLHRFLALLTFAAAAGLVVAAARLGQPQPLPRLAKHIFHVVVGQALLGVLTLYSFSHYPSLYYPLSILHLAWGTVLLLGAVGALLTLRYGTAGRFHKTKAI